ncbi:hypothetical protein HGM15179_018772 [Zosterops borbonicus]|uniref:Uncharacterized protein n=1 Tax=Zosterops borbonicus TaxID=364589 RepID=A0A8K1DBI5_9PASS|nr:hypothetical protein HGM15179_018772 [Zosterops borbonicus]
MSFEVPSDPKKPRNFGNCALTEERMDNIPSHLLHPHPNPVRSRILWDFDSFPPGRAEKQELSWDFCGAIPETSGTRWELWVGRDRDKPGCWTSPGRSFEVPSDPKKSQDCGNCALTEARLRMDNIPSTFPHPNPSGSESFGILINSLDEQRNRNFYGISVAQLQKFLEHGGNPTWWECWTSPGMSFEVPSDPKKYQNCGNCVLTEERVNMDNIPSPSPYPNPIRIRILWDFDSFPPGRAEKQKFLWDFCGAITETSGTRWDLWVGQGRDKPGWWECWTSPGRSFEVPSDPKKSQNCGNCALTGERLRMDNIPSPSPHPNPNRSRILWDFDSSPG